METALNRLSKISKIHNEKTFSEWYENPFGYDSLISDIREVVALATAKQQPKTQSLPIDAMRFEAAKTILLGRLTSGNYSDSDAMIDYTIKLADLFIDRLKKPKPCEY